MSAMDQETFPRGALVAVAGLVGITLVGTAAVRLQKLSTPAPTPRAEPAPADSVYLRFIDEADGSVSVRQATDNRLVTSIRPGTGGFVRGVVRGLAHDRRTRGIGAEAPFRLSESDASRLTLQDMATGRRIDLEAFGSSNRDAFLRLLHPESARL